MQGTGEYPANWWKIAQDVKAEAGWKCVRCNHPNQATQKAGRMVASDHGCGPDCIHMPNGKQRILTVHHLDGDKANCVWWNMTALCQVCHLNVQARVFLGQSYLHPHTPWFRPYVAGFYASTVLGEDLTRAQVVERLDELLMAGQPHLSALSIQEAP